MFGIKEFIYVEDAISRLCNSIKLNIGIEEVRLVNALGRVSANTVKAPYDYPPFDRSVVDGFAVRAEDTYGASPNSPVELKLLGRIDVGSLNKIEVGRGEVVEVSTGAPIPKGANAVVMKEDVKVLGNKVIIYSQVPAFANIARKGEDVRVGEEIISEGEVITPFHIAALATYGISKVKVLRRLRVGVIPTGSEVVDIEEELGEGKVYDSTSYLILTYLRRYRFIDAIRICSPLPDDEEVIRSVITKALNEYDIIITTGGTSVGRRDLVPKAVASIGGAEIVFRGVAIRPGRPASAAVVNGKPIFMISGFPVAAYSALEQIIMPVIKRILGIKVELVPKVYARLVRKIPNAVGYNSLVRVKTSVVNNEILAEPIRLKGSGSIRTLIEGDAATILPHDIEGFESNEVVPIKLIRYSIG